MSTIQIADPANTVLTNLCDPTTRVTYAALSELSNVPTSTLCDRAHGRQSRSEKAAKQQYLTPQEEKALVNYALRMSRNGYPLPVKSLRSLALVMVRQRSSPFQIPSIDDEVRPPGKNWPQGFYKRHPELKARRVKALDWNRHDNSIYDKVVHWFAVIGRELHDPAIRQENVYNVDETEVLLSVLGSLKVLTGRDDLNSRGAGVKRTLITAIECISADGRSLHPLIIWPATTHRSTWTTYPAPGWHFACSQSGYTDTAISLYWIRNVFDPQTRARANNKPRILISDGFGTHESLEVMTFCYENNIILCRLPSHTSHKLQPCDVGAFGPLKTAYREQVEQLYRGGVNTIGKQHFAFLYSRAREVAFTRRNIQSCWSKTGLFPFNPDRVLGEIKKPQKGTNDLRTNTVLKCDPPPCGGMLQTPTTSEALSLFRSQIEQDIHRLDGPCKLRLQKLGNAAENVIAERALLFDDNRLLFAQNNEKAYRQSTRSTVIGNAKVMSYDDIVETQKKRDAKEGGRIAKRKCLGRPPGQGIRSRAQEVRPSDWRLGVHKGELRRLSERQWNAMDEMSVPDE